MDGEIGSPDQCTLTGTRPLLFRIDAAPAEPGLQDCCARAVEAGFDGVELAPTAGDEDGKEREDVCRCSDGSATLPMEKPSVLDGLAERNLRIGALAVRCSTTDAEAGIAEVAELLNQAASCGVRCLNVTVAPASYQAALNFAYRLIRDVRFEAEHLGIAVALEAGADGCLLSPVELREIIDAANSWAVGACIDVNRIAAFGSPDDWITTLGSRVHAVRVHDVAGCDSSRAGTPEAALNLEDIAVALDEVRSAGIVIAAGAGSPGDVRRHMTPPAHGAHPR